MTGPRLTELAAISLAMLLLAACNSGPQGVRFLNGTDQASQARRLSLSRALTVRSYLISQGVRSTRIDVRALGARASDGPADRVDLLIGDR